MAESTDREAPPSPHHATMEHASQGLGIHEHCVTDRPTPSGQAVAGEIIKLNDVDTYVTKPPSYPQTPARLLLFLSGGTGIRSTNNQLQADRFAVDGNFVVVMPDLFANDPAPNTETIAPTESRSMLDLLQLRAVEISKSFMIDMWLARHTEQHAMPILYRVLDAVRDEFADAVTAGDGVYAVGYCIGGRYVLLLGAEKQEVAWGWDDGSSVPKKAGEADVEATAGTTSGTESQTRGGPLIKTGVVAHAAQVTPGDFATLKAPVSLVCVEGDQLFTDEVRTAAEDAMVAAALEHEVKVYPGVPHGFAVVGEYKDQHIRDAQATAYEQMLRWLQDH